MNIKEAKDACMNRLRVVVTKEGGASFRGHHIEGIIHKPDYKTGKWRPFALIAYGEDDNFTYYGSGSNGDPEIPIERVYVDRNQDSPGRKGRNCRKVTGKEGFSAVGNLLRFQC